MQTTPQKMCSKCGAVKLISEFYRDRGARDGRRSACKACDNNHLRLYRSSDQYKSMKRDWERRRNHANGKHLPMSDSRDCPAWLGIHIAERVVSKVFSNARKMPNNNPGYDFVCSRGLRIDVKSSCRHCYNGRWSPHWIFTINRNAVADYFVLIAFDDRCSVTPQHVWIVPGNVLRHLASTTISESTIDKWSAYEQPIDIVTSCCDHLKSEVSHAQTF